MSHQFDLTDDQLQIQEMAAKFTADAITPFAAEWDENLDRCDRKYNYGWGVLFGEEPLSVSKTPDQP